MTDQSSATADNAELIARLPKDFAELETWIGEARDEGYLEGQADCAGAHAELWNKVIRWAESRDLLGEPEADTGGYTAEELFDAIASHENELDQALIKAGVCTHLEVTAARAEAAEARVSELTEAVAVYDRKLAAEGEAHLRTLSRHAAAEARATALEAKTKTFERAFILSKSAHSKLHEVCCEEAKMTPKMSAAFKNGDVVYSQIRELLAALAQSGEG